ncbi:MAG: ABC transporter ATP-binding protein, partial [Pseudomonadota bacterium]|nr:ABC transporter ATP-binding protein [Pseudomonadota bacterium]
RRLLEARRAFQDGLPADLRDAVAFYKPDEYNVAASLQDNILFGRIAHGVAGAADRVLKAVRAVLDELGLRDQIIAAGLNFNIGSGGKRLSASQRQKLGLARALLKRPDFLIVNRALSALDHRVQAAIMDRVLDQARAGDRPCGVLWVLTGPLSSDKFDRILRFENGMLVEDNTLSVPAPEAGRQAEMVPAQ